GNGSFLFLFRSGNQHVRNLLALCLADLISNLLGTCIHFHTDTCCLQLLVNFLCIIRIFVGNRKHFYLNRSQPGRERSCEMLDQDTDETLDGTERHAMDHDRTMFLSVCSCVLQLKPQRKLEIQLDGSALPGSSDGVLQMEVDLRSVECSVTFVYYILQSQFIQSRAKRLCCNLPVLVASHAVFRT